MIVLVTGGRDHRDPSLIHATLDGLLGVYSADEITIVHGDAKGVDTFAAEWAKRHGIATVAYPADWNRHGKKAGVIRNQKMLDEMDPDMIMAFPTRKSKGTWDMVRRAERRDYPVIVTEE